MIKKGIFMTGFAVIALAAFAFFSKSSDKELNVAKKVEGVLEEKPFVIVTASFNNDAYFERNLDAIFSQEYKNYRVIYVEDASTDNTYSHVKEYIERYGVQDKIQLIHNTDNRKALYNLYTAVHSCKNDEIVVLLDGDDWLTSSSVLKDLNAYYANQDVWLTYGQYMRYPDDQIGMCAPVTKGFLRKGEMRQGKWQYSHLRTFYAGLFKRIQLKDLVEDNHFFTAAWDLALMLPMMEMAREHSYFTPDVFYVYNYETPLTDAKIRLAEQERIEKKVRSMPVYLPLECDPRTPFGEGSFTDIMVFSYNRPMQLYACLESMEKYIHGVRSIQVIYRESQDYNSGYEEVKKAFPQIQFFKQSQEPKKDFKPLVMEGVFGNRGQGADYILFAVDDIIITDKIDLQKDIIKLQETGAYGCFYRLGTHLNYCFMTDQPQKVPPLLEVGEGLLAWQFNKGEWDWNYPNALDLVLYKKESIRQDLEKVKFTYPNDFEGGWCKLADATKFGICYEKAKMVNIPMNAISKNPRAAYSFTIEALNEMFLEGLKIDIDPLYQTVYRSAHEDVRPQFVMR